MLRSLDFEEAHASSSFNTSWIESIPQRISDQDEKQQGHYEHGEGGKGDPPRVEVVLALVEELPQARRPRRHAEFEEVEAGERPIAAAISRGNERDHGRQAVRQDVAPDDGPVALAERARART